MPVDRLVDEADRLITLGVTELACRLGIDSGSFARAADNLKRASGLSLSAERLRVLVEHEGKLLLSAQREEQLELEFTAGDCTTRQTPGGGVTTRIYLGVDGVKVPTVTDAEKHKRRANATARRKKLPRRRGVRRGALPAVKRGADLAYKEFKIVTLYDQDQLHRYVRATRKDHRAAGKLIRQASAQLLLRTASEKVAIADGADWIWNQIDQNVTCLDAKVLDFYHLAEHVHAAKRTVFGEEPAGRTWAEKLLHTVKHEGYEPFWSQLVQTRSTLRSIAKRGALDGLMHYVAGRRELLDYRRCGQNNWDIGSGSTESMCKALTRRIKQRGMRWDADNAEAVMALETLEQMQSWPAWRKARELQLN